jgi:parallel beta-helix repeat protein
MNSLSVRLNDRKTVLLSAGLAALIVLLAGGANAFANTVWCVPMASLNPACTAASTKAHIQDAVSAASDQDVIVVGPGYYKETVLITTGSISIFGAQAGRDARVGRDNPAKESIVDASGTPYGSGGGAAFLVEVPNVVIDGFTIQGGTNGTTANASGIFVAGWNLIQILNNIIQNNAVGVYIKGSNPGLVEHNLFKTNNAGAAGSAATDFAGKSGFGVVVYGSVGIAVTDNEFKGNLAVAVALDQAGGSEVTENTSKNDGSFAVFYGSVRCYFSRNQGQDFGAQGFHALPGGNHADAAVDVGLGNNSLHIKDNDLEEGRTSNYSGIAFSTIFGSGQACGFCEVTNNRVKRFAGNGIAAESSSGTGTLFASSISGNEVEDNGNDGILIEAASVNWNAVNSLLDNEAEGNHVNDCEDDTTGGGTLLTGNTWFNNIGSLSHPAGLCAPGAGHYYEY